MRSAHPTNVLFKQALRAADEGRRKSRNALMVMGTHLYDWMRLFAGDVEWAHVHLEELDGRESTVHDINDAQEINPGDQNDGLVLGERGFASFRFKNGVHAEADFLAEEQGDDRGYGIDLIDTEGRVAVRESVGTTMFIHRRQHHLPTEKWERVVVEEEGNDAERRPGERRERLFLQRLMIRYLIAAIEEDRSLAASGRGGVASMEMIGLTWESHRHEARGYAPLTPREHPLERWRRDEGIEQPTGRSRTLTFRIEQESNNSLRFSKANKHAMVGYLTAKSWITPMTLS